MDIEKRAERRSVCVCVCVNKNITLMLYQKIERLEFLFPIVAMVIAMHCDAANSLR